MIYASGSKSTNLSSASPSNVSECPPSHRNSPYYQTLRICWSINTSIVVKMAQSCIASSKSTLPSALRSIFRAEFASESRFQRSIYNQPKHLSLHRAPLPSSRTFQTERCFSSAPATRSAQSAPSNKPSKDSEKPPRDARNWRDAQSLRERKPSTTYQKKKKPEGWQIQKEALKQKFEGGWNPPKKLSPDALDGIRHLHAMAPDRFTTPVLAEEFKISPEAIRRILKSKWRASEAQMDDRRKRWEKRHDKIWSQMAELGLRPKVKRHQALNDVNVLYEDSPNKS